MAIGPKAPCTNSQGSQHRLLQLDQEKAQDKERKVRKKAEVLVIALQAKTQQDTQGEI